MFFSVVAIREKVYIKIGSGPTWNQGDISSGPDDDEISAINHYCYSKEQDQAVNNTRFDLLLLYRWP